MTRKDETPDDRAMRIMNEIMQDPRIVTDMDRQRLKALVGGRCCRFGTKDCGIDHPEMRPGDIVYCWPVSTKPATPAESEREMERIRRDVTNPERMLIGAATGDETLAALNRLAEREIARERSKLRAAGRWLAVRALRLLTYGGITVGGIYAWMEWAAR